MLNYGESVQLFTYERVQLRWNCSPTIEVFTRKDRNARKNEEREENSGILLLNGLPVDIVNLHTRARQNHTGPELRTGDKFELRGWSRTEVRQ